MQLSDSMFSVGTPQFLPRVRDPMCLPRAVVVKLAGRENERRILWKQRQGHIIVSFLTLPELTI